MAIDKKKSLSTLNGVSPTGKHNNAINGDPRKPKNKGVSAQPEFIGASAENNSPALSEADRVVFEVLMTEAELSVGRKLKQGKTILAAIDEVSNDMELNGDEASALQDRLINKTITTPTHPKLKTTKKSETSNIRPLSIYFEDTNQANDATDMLMNKGIPWAVRDVDDTENPCLQFSNPQSFDEAHSALKRKWDFVEQNPRHVGNLQFDNLDHYNKVVDFMTQQGMMMEPTKSHNLVPDVLEESKDSSKEDNRSFKAHPKNMKKPAKLDPVKNTEHRQLNIRKKWR